MSPAAKTPAKTKKTTKTPVVKARHEDLALSLKPRMSEKSYALSSAENTYVFEVPLDSNKASVSAAVAAQFSVEVSDVRLANIKGKSKRSYKRRARPLEAKRSDIKKAFVKLNKGSSIPIFEAMEEEMAKEAEETTDKPTAKVINADQQPAKQSRLRRALGRGSRQVQEKGGGK